MPQSLTLYLMLYNERESFVSVVEEIVHVAMPSGWTRHVVIIDDGSTDGSSALADELADKYPAVSVIHHAENKGLGGVYRTGFEAAASGWITFLPADGQYRVSETLRLLPETEGHDLVLSVLDGRRESLVGRVLSGFERSLFFLLFGPTPRFQGIFAIKADVVRTMSLQSRGRGWAIVLEMILRAKRLGYRWANVSVQCRPREAGQSKVNNARTIVASILQLFRLRWLLFRYP